MNNILEKIKAAKEVEVSALYEKYSLDELKKNVVSSPISFYEKLAQKKALNQPFLISEFKRKSPSEGWINEEVSIESQIQKYIDFGTDAVSVLTDNQFFGGSYEDLNKAASWIENVQNCEICVLNKEFIIDEIQVYLARKNGANLILLIAEILDVESFENLKNLAESLGMGVLAEVHNLPEFKKIEALNCKVIGVNNRNLDNFKTAINNCNFLAQYISKDSFLIAESGMHNSIDLKVAGTYSDGFLIGTSLMRNSKLDFSQECFFKACGMRSSEEISNNRADLVGVNFSPKSKRKVNEKILADLEIPQNAVALFYKNSESDIDEILSNYHFKYIQVYFEDVSFEFIKNCKHKIMLAVKVKGNFDFNELEQYAPFVDFFILDSAEPGSGKSIQSEIPFEFPYPFLLAGGMNLENLNRIEKYKNCIGVDIASGVETAAKVDLDKIKNIKSKIEKIGKVELFFEK